MLSSDENEKDASVSVVGFGGPLVSLVLGGWIVHVRLSAEPTMLPSTPRTLNVWEPVTRAE